MLAGMWGNGNTHSPLVSQNWYNHYKIKEEAPPKERNKYNTRSRYTSIEHMLKVSIFHYTDTCFFFVFTAALLEIARK